MGFVDELRGVLGSDRVKDHPLEMHIYDKDAGVTRGPVAAVALPETTEETAHCVRIARRWNVPIVARGAGTGLAGGAVPTQPGLLVVMTRMNEIWEVDAENRTAWVGPGVLNLDLSVHTASLGLHYAPDPSSQSVCTVGGNVGTNAGGPHCLADGTTVAHILAVEMVTVDGDVVVLGGPAPDPIGLDLRAVVVGSEGTMGIVTRILVRLTETAPAEQTLLMAFAQIEDAAATVSGIIAAGVVPAALEMMDRPMVRAVENFVGAGYPTDAAAVLLAEVSGHPAAVAAEAAVVAAVAAEQGATEVRVAADDEERRLLWLGRKSAFGAVAQAAPDYYLHDTVVPRTRLVGVLTQVYEIAARHDLAMLNVFHAGDGNLHPLVAFDAKEPGVLDRVRSAAEEMVRISIEAGGTLSGEHGIGLEKRDLMGEVFAPVDLDAQARLRDAFDPRGALNPGKILPAGSRCYDFGMRSDLGEEPA
jgi:glycolate oxidase